MWTAAGLVAVPVLVTIAVGALSASLFPDDRDDAEFGPRLIAVLILAAVAVLVVARSHAWRRVGAAGPLTWRHTRLLTIPMSIALAPVVTGFRSPTAELLAVLAVGYAATGIFEELWHRGVVLDALRSLGVRRSAVVGGAFFGASHLANIAFGQPVTVSLAQGIGAACFGIGFSVFRWRTNAIWLLAGIHALGDLMFQITRLHGGALWGFLVVHDTLMLLWGLWCLRGLDDDLSQLPEFPD